jgi:1-acyl-sn-glycerol-3-phosphate acyltransferase
VRTRLRVVSRTWRATRVAIHVAQGWVTTVAVFPLVANDTRRALIRRWSARLLALLHIDARVKGSLEAHRGNVLMVANHVSWLDIFVLNAAHPARFVAKSELGRWPLAGTLMRGAGTLFLARERRHDTRRINRHATEALAGGDVIAVFPEGTTTDGTQLLKFHASLLQPVVDSDGHLQPVALRYVGEDGALSTAPSYGDESIAASFWRICGERALAVEVIPAAAIPARDLTRRELARHAEAAIRTALALPVAATGPGTRADPRDESP